MNRDKIGTQTCYIHQCTKMYIACLCPNLVSVHFYAIPILHFKFTNFFIYLYATKGLRLSKSYSFRQRVRLTILDYSEETDWTMTIQTASNKRANRSRYCW